MTAPHVETPLPESDARSEMLTRMYRLSCYLADHPTISTAEELFSLPNLPQEHRQTIALRNARHRNSSPEYEVVYWNWIIAGARSFAESPYYRTMNAAALDVLRSA